MRKVIGAVFVMVLAVSLVLVPSPVSAGIGDDCTWDPVKWETNENSWNLYLMHWGRTPVTAMSRLAGLCAPPNICNPARGTDCAIGSGRYLADPNDCTLGGCSHCRVVQEGFLAGCSDPAGCEASMSGEACPALGMTEEECAWDPIYEGYCPKCCCCWGVSLAFANKSWAACDISDHPRVNNEHLNHFGNSEGGGANYGGDWGISGCAHTDCISQTWCLQDNLCATCSP